MAIVRPFPSIRPGDGKIKDIAALPYDVFSEKEARAYVINKPLSFLNIDRAEVNFPEGTDLYSEQVYVMARKKLAKMIEQGHYIKDVKACFYVYQLDNGVTRQTGIVARTSIDDYLNDVIKKHELTRADKEADRINHVDYCDANTGPIFMAYKHSDTISSIIEVVKEQMPIYDFVSDDGVEQRVWLIDNDEQIAQITQAFTEVNGLYIADGHHRAASAVKVGLKRRNENPNYTGKEGFNYFLSVLFPDNELKIMDYNRVVKDLNGLTSEQLLESLNKHYMVHQIPTEKAKSLQVYPTSKGLVSMYLKGSWYLLIVRPETLVGLDVVGKLDVSILQEKVLGPLLGIEDPRTSKRIDFIGGIRGVKEIVARVESDMEVGFLMSPVTISDLMAISDEGKLMPPKSTWFEPKLYSGIFIHDLSDKE